MRLTAHTIGSRSGDLREALYILKRSLDEMDSEEGLTPAIVNRPRHDAIQPTYILQMEVPVLFPFLSFVWGQV